MSQMEAPTSDPAVARDTLAARLGRARRRYGVRRIPGRVWHHARRRMVGDACLVYRFDTSLAPDPVGGLRIERYVRWADVQTAVADAIGAAEGTAALSTVEENVRQGRSLWVAALDGRVAGYLLIARRHQLETWYVPLQEHDLVVYSVVVFPDLRGKGIAPSMVAEAVLSELAPGQQAYVDTRAWNASAIRFILKAGFRHIATRQPPGRRGA
ncbi:MAG TPA: GNAT family N-acetyltransferase [Thermoleophilaceae bacterium]|jgi:GNAT superfamily N-acetyltransferase